MLRADSLSSRVILAVLVGIGTSTIFVAAQVLLGNNPSGPWLGADFFQIWAMLQALRSGMSPYVMGCPLIPPCADANQYYPVTAGLAVWPLGYFTPAVASTFFVGFSAACLAFAMFRRDRHRVALFLSYPFFIAVISGQWAPLIMAASLTKGAEWLYAAKPQLGLALFVARPRVRTIVLCCAFAVVSLLVMPGWPLEWWNAASDSRYVGSPILHFAWFAPILLLSALRWRTPEGRLLLALSLVPQTPYCYDQLLLWFVPRTHRESLNLTWLSWLMLGAWRVFAYPKQTDLIVLATFAPYNVLFLFIPCLIMVLRRPNRRAVVRTPEVLHDSSEYPLQAAGSRP
jgi:hypothetical protein